MRKYSLIFTDEFDRVCSVSTVHTSSLPLAYKEALQAATRSYTRIYLVTYRSKRLIAFGVAVGGFLVDYYRYDHELKYASFVFDDSGVSRLSLKEV